MARGELLRKLFKSFKQSNSDEFEKTALQIIAEEKQKNNHQLAKDLMHILEGVNGVKTDVIVKGNFTHLPQDRERHLPLAEIRTSVKVLSDAVFDKNKIESIERILSEFRKTELLKTHALEPISKILFCGPPGCGKTLCAEIIANELGLPMLYCRFDAIVSSYLGETAANLRKIFDFAAQGQWVVMFDEFDAIGKARDDHNEHGELKRVVNSFLQMLDGFKSSSLVIAATNHEKLLDPALWRRFDEILYFQKPSLTQIKTTLSLKLKNFPHEVNLIKESEQLKGMSFSDIERICFDAIKSAIINDEDKVNKNRFDQTVSKHKIRLQIAKNAIKKIME